MFQHNSFVQQTPPPQPHQRSPAHSPSPPHRQIYGAPRTPSGFDGGIVPQSPPSSYGGSFVQLPGYGLNQSDQRFASPPRSRPEANESLTVTGSFVSREPAPVAHPWQPPPQQKSAKPKVSNGLRAVPLQETSCRKRPLHLVSASAQRQHPLKREQGYIYADAVVEHPTLLGICDGVSGVQSLGVQPDELPKALLDATLQVHTARLSRRRRGERQPQGEADGRWIIRMLKDAFDHTKCKGASTVLLAALEESHQLVVANIGDCGLMLLRPVPYQPTRLTNEYRSEALRYEARRPKQVVRLDCVAPADVHKVIEDAQISVLPCKRGDLIVLGSDGIFDNLTDQEVVQIVEDHCARAVHVAEPFGIAVPSDYGPCEPMERRGPVREHLEAAAEALVSAAIDNAGHLSNQARLALGGEGGNADDTTALVAVVVEGSAEVGSDGLRQRGSFAASEPESAHEFSTWSASLASLDGLLPHCCRATNNVEDIEEAFPSHYGVDQGARLGLPGGDSQKHGDTGNDDGFCHLS